MKRHGVGTWDFSTGRVSDGFRGLMAELIGRTRELFEEGRPLCDRVGRELRFEMRLTWLGGMSILDRIEAVGADVFTPPSEALRSRQGGSGLAGLAVALPMTSTPGRPADAARARATSTTPS